MTQIKTFIIAALVLSAGSLARATDPYGSLCQKITSDEALPEYNSQVMKAVSSMPEGGGYKATDDRIDALASAIDTSDGQMKVDPARAGQSFCSGATYLVFLTVVGAEQKAKKLKLSSEALDEIKILSKDKEPDGSGVWGRWNADGPGTSTLFKELDLGRNFSSVNEAKPGDFLKIFWNDKIGKGEHGHSVVFDSLRTCNGARHICFWSSNTANDLETPGDGKKGGGWGMKCVPETKAFRTVFSRVENLNNLNKAPALMGKKSSNYSQKTLADLGNRSLSPTEMGEMIYKTQGPSAAPQNAQ